MHFTTPSFEYALNVVPEIPLSTINFYIAYIGITEVIALHEYDLLKYYIKFPLKGNIYLVICHSASAYDLN